MRQNAKKWPKTLPKGAILKNSTAYAKPPQKGFAPPKGGLEGRLVNSHLTRWWVRGPPRIVYASRIPPRPHGDDELRTSVYPSNMAPIGVKLWENAFQTICNFRFFDAQKSSSIFFDVEKSKIANRLKRVFPKFEANRRYVGGVNGRSKFEVAHSK